MTPASNWKQAEALAAVAGRHFHRGVLLYTCQVEVPFAERILALPVAALWRTAAWG